MYCVSDWYLSLGLYTFPTLFIQLNNDEIELIRNVEDCSNSSRNIIRKIDSAVTRFPGSSFIHVDYCAPTDSSLFQKGKGAINSGKTGWNILSQSEKVKKAFAEDKTKRICVHPYRRIDHAREFRVFTKAGTVVGVSQKDVAKHHPKLHKRRDFIQRKIYKFMKHINSQLETEDIIVDVYLTSQDELMILDTHSWGGATNPLLFRDWDRDWSKNSGLVLVEKPEKLGGNVSVSF